MSTNQMHPAAAVTGEQLYNAGRAEIFHGAPWADLADEVQAGWSRAAARLSVPGFDVEAVVEEVRAGMRKRGWNSVSDADKDAADCVRAALRRHAAPVVWGKASASSHATPVATIPNAPVAPAAPVVVPVEVSVVGYRAIVAHADAMWKESQEIGYENCFVDALNDHLRAHAADVVACRVVRRPVEEVSTIKTPKECGVRDTEYVYIKTDFGVGYCMADQFDAATTEMWSVAGGEWHRRTTQPVSREWRAEDVPLGDVIVAHQADDGTALYYHFSPYTARQSVADFANRRNVHALLVLPTAVGGAPA